MTSVLRSLATAAMIAAVVLLFAIHVVAPILPPVVGPPDIRETKQLKLPSAKQLQISAVDGAVKVWTHPDAQVDQVDVTADIRVYLRPKADTDLAKRHVARLVNAYVSDGVLSVISEPVDRPENMDIRINYTIIVPPETDIDVTGSNGNVWISKGCGRVAVRGDNSDIEIKQPGGMVVAESINGRIRVLDAPSDAKLSTTNGNIYAHMLGGTLEARTMNGHIVARVLEQAVDRFDLMSQNGGITLVLHEDAKARVDVQTVRGSIRTDFDIVNELGAGSYKHFRGRIGEGGPELTASTVNGNIWIARG